MGFSRVHGAAKGVLPLANHIPGGGVTALLTGGALVLAGLLGKALAERLHESDCIVLDIDTGSGRIKLEVDAEEPTKGSRMEDAY